MSREHKGKGCMICMNILLLILGAVLIAGSAYVMTGKDIPPVFEALAANCMYLIAAGVVLIIFSIIGICASCGGCLLYLYAIFITLITIVFLIITIVFAAAYFTIKPENEDSIIVSTIDNITLAIVKNEETAEDWKVVQDSFNCCGYKGEGRTGDVCFPDPASTAAPASDCRDLFFGVITQYSLYATILVFATFLVLLILSCASCTRWKDDDCCQC